MCGINLCVHVYKYGEREYEAISQGIMNQRWILLWYKQSRLDLEKAAVRMLQH